jgi:hypothetical protein
MTQALREALEKAINTEEKDATPATIESTQPDEVGTDEGEGEHTGPVEVENGSEQPVDDEATGVEEREEEGSGVKEPKEREPAFAKAPASWKGQAKEVWAALPEQARKEVIRREKQINQTLQETATIRQDYQAVQQVAQKYSERLQAWNAHPAQVIDQFMDADQKLSSGPMQSRAAYMAKLISEYGIDIGELDNALSGNTPPAYQPDIEARVAQLVEQRLAPLTQRFQAEEQREVQQVAQTIQSMENNPDYPHFEEVRGEMADLIEINFKRGVSVSLSDAYDRVTGYRGYGKPNKAEETQRALNASVSVGGSPAATVNAGNPLDLRGTILKALEGGRR